MPTINGSCLFLQLCNVGKLVCHFLTNCLLKIVIKNVLNRDFQFYDTLNSYKGCSYTLSSVRFFFAYSFFPKPSINQKKIIYSAFYNFQIPSDLQLINLTYNALF